MSKYQRALAGTFAAIGLTAAMLIVNPNGAKAHLSMIRQGAESQGAIEAADRFGTAVAAGDFNGDGHDDLATGASLEDVSGVANTGMVIISYGTPYGLTHEGADAVLVPSAGGVNETDGEFGSALASGDFNNDGFSDLAIGMPGSAAGVGNADAGMVFVLRGSASGLVSWAQIDQADVGGGREVGDRFGASLAVGDFDNDGYDDLAAGSPGEDANAGAVFWMLGASTGVPNGGSGWFKQSTLGGTDEADDSFGWSLAAGNVFGSNNDDLAVGAPYEDIGTPQSHGQVWLIRGASTGLSTSLPKVYSASIHDTAQTGGNFGFALAIGRFPQSLTWKALAIGEPGRDGGLIYDRAGRVVIAKGASAGLDTTTTIAVDQTDADGSNRSDDEFGSALCAGTFEVESDTYDDLGVGSKGESFTGAWPDAGNFYVLFGGSSGPTGQYGWASFNQGTCNEYSEQGDEFGEALCFGRFDSTNKGTFVVGAPGEDQDAGIVHVIAPWRQVYALGCNQSIVYDCEENLVFSAKPFDTVWVASTTKTMTCLIAAERAQLSPGNPNYIDLDQVIEVPNWVVYDVPGSQVPLQFRERMNLRDLMYTCMMLSGNDAAFAIAWFIHGGTAANCATAFANEMNARAAQLGMNGTHFHNPAGLDNEPGALGYEMGEHYSTPADMAKLSRAAMNNTLLAEIVGTETYSMTRQFFVGNNTWEGDNFTFNNFFIGILTNAMQPGTGIKGGTTPLAGNTALLAAESNAGGTAIAGFYGLPIETDLYVDDSARLLQLGIGQCGQIIDITTGGYLQSFYDLSSFLDQRVGGAGQWGPPPNPDQLRSTFDLFRTNGQGPTSADLTLRRIAELDFASNESVALGTTPFQRHDGIVITNMEATAITFEVTFSWGQPPMPVQINPGQSGLIPPYTSPSGLPSATITLRNTTGQPSAGIPAHVTVEEAYSFDVEDPSYEAWPCFTADVLRRGPLVGDSFEFLFTGQDALNGSSFNMIVHDPNALTGVGDAGGLAPVDGAAAAPLRLLAASPNPFTVETRIGFALTRAGRVGVSIYDVSGRLVRALDETRFEAGDAAIAWDGREDDGRRVAPGVFFYRVTLDGAHAAQGKLVTLSR